MILQSLTKYYEVLADKGEIPQLGWSVAQVSDRVVIDSEGRLKSIISAKVQQQKGKKIIEVNASMKVPEQAKRSSGVKANFLCDAVPYLFGINVKPKENDAKKEQKNIQRAKECFEASRALHHQILDKCKSPTARAVLRFYDTWNPDNALNDPVIVKNFEDLTRAANLIFQVDHTDAQNDSEIRKVWENSREKPSGDEVCGRCLVTGEADVPIARLHPNIKGVQGAQSSGAALVSFNTSSPAYESFGHNGDQGLNAPVSKRATFEYTTALNYLIRSGRRVLLGDSTVVYWSESGSGGYQDTFDCLINGERTGLNESEVRSVIDAILQGHPAELKDVILSPDEPFYLLALAPNAARLSVRFFYWNTFGRIIENVNQHYEYMKIVRPDWEKKDFIPMWRLLKSTVNPHSKDSAASPLMAGSLLRSIVEGYRYPESAYQNIMLRVFSDQDEIDEKGKRLNYKITYVKAAFIKAYLLKNCKSKWGEEITMTVNENCSEISYVLGRLFAVLEGLQQAANPEVNTTIKDRYFNSACATPSTVFPVLMKLSNAHLGKLEKGKQIYYSKKIGELLEKISVPDSGRAIPPRLSLDEQGMFVLGYYQETQDRFTKKEDK
jgi:CRISPR-associated protein Csd1